MPSLLAERAHCWFIRFIWFIWFKFGWFSSGQQDKPDKRNKPAVRPLFSHVFTN
jgi:hypothetical protein